MHTKAQKTINEQINKSYRFVFIYIFAITPRGYIRIKRKSNKQTNIVMVKIYKTITCLQKNI